MTLSMAFSYWWPLSHALDGDEVLFEVVDAQTPHVYIKWHLLSLFLCLLRVSKAVVELYRTGGLVQGTREIKGAVLGSLPIV